MVDSAGACAAGRPSAPAEGVWRVSTWIVPGRGQPGEGQAPIAFHGSTIRIYDPTIDV
jgi:hypothetical protein